MEKIELFREGTTNQVFKEALLVGFNEIQTVLSNYFKFTKSNILDIGEREILGLLQQGIIRNHTSNNFFCTQEVKAGNKNQRIDLIFIDSNNNAILFEAKKWEYLNKFQHEKLLKRIQECTTTLKRYHSNLGFNQYLKGEVKYVPIFFEVVNTANELSVFNINIKELYKKCEIDFVHTHKINSQYLVIYGIFK